MLGNVWMVIWPNQKIVIGSVRQQLAGGEADPEQPTPPSGAPVRHGPTRSSRSRCCGSWCSPPTSPPRTRLKGDLNNPLLYWILVLVLWAFVEASALGYIGGLDNAFNKAVFDDHNEDDHLRLRLLGRDLLHRLGSAPEERVTLQQRQLTTRLACMPAARWPGMSQ